MTEQHLTALFESVDVDGEPPFPPGHVEQLVAAGRRSVRRQRVTTLLAVLAMVTVAVGVAGLGRPGEDRLTPAVPGPAGAGLPDRIAPFSLLTGDVSTAPAGRAIMIYQYGNGELFNVWQELALGADGDTYRRIDAAGGRRPWLLSPDGTTVIMAEQGTATFAFTLVDLVTGEKRSVPLPAPTGVIPLAISPDGRYVAYSTVAVPADAGQIGNAIEFEGSQRGTLAIIDLTTGQSTSHPQLTPVQAAAFAPDSRRLAVQTALETWIVSIDGQRERKVQLPSGYGILPEVAWSPDGKLLAAIGWSVESWTRLDGSIAKAYHPYGSDKEKMRFIDATGAGAPVPEPVAVEDVLGWLSGDRILTMTRAEVNVLSDVPLNGGQPTVLSRFDDGMTCEYGLQTCQAFEISMASGLLLSLTVRPAEDPDRGPMPLWLWLVVAVPIVITALVVALVVIRVRRRRRRLG